MVNKEVPLRLLRKLAEWGRVRGVNKEIPLRPPSSGSRNGGRMWGAKWAAAEGTNNLHITLRRRPWFLPLCATLPIPDRSVAEGRNLRPLQWFFPIDATLPIPQVRPQVARSGTSILCAGSQKRCFSVAEGRNLLAFFGQVSVVFL